MILVEEKSTVKLKMKKIKTSFKFDKMQAHKTHSSTWPHLNSSYGFEYSDIKMSKY